MKYCLLLIAMALFSIDSFTQENRYLQAEAHYNSCKDEDCLFQLFLDLKEEYKSESEEFLNILAYANAERKYNPKKAFEIIQKQDFQIAKRSEFERGIYFHSLGAISVISENPIVALNHFKTALKSFERSESSYFTAKNYMSLGRTYTALDSLDTGLIYLHEASTLVSDNYPELKQLITLNKAVNRKMAGDLDRAKQIFVEALKIMALNNSEPYLMCRTEANLAEILMLQGKYDSADSLYQMALLKATSSNLRSDQIRINNDLSHLYERIGAYKKSLFYLHRKDSLRNNARLLSISDQMGQLESQYDLEILTQEKEYQHQLLKNEQKIVYILTTSLVIIIALVILILRQLTTLRNKNKVLIEKISSKHNNKLKIENTQNTAYLYPLIKRLEEIKSNEKVILEKSLTLEKLAKELNTNRSYLSEAINVGFDATFSKWLNQIRVEKACELLSNPENDKYSLEAIANMVGFASISSFNTNFKRITGLTPSYYKNHRLSN